MWLDFFVLLKGCDSLYADSGSVLPCCQSAVAVKEIFAILKNAIWQKKDDNNFKIYNLFLYFYKLKRFCFILPVVQGVKVGMARQQVIIGMMMELALVCECVWFDYGLASPFYEGVFLK